MSISDVVVAIFAVVMGVRYWCVHFRPALHRRRAERERIKQATLDEEWFSRLHTGTVLNCCFGRFVVDDNLRAVCGSKYYDLTPRMRNWFTIEEPSGPW